MNRIPSRLRRLSGELDGLEGEVSDLCSPVLEIGEGRSEFELTNCFSDVVLFGELRDAIEDSDVLGESESDEKGSDENTH
jgi:hypothetical protein